MSELSLDQALKLASGVLAEGRRSECAPLTVAVLDPGGHLRAFCREDGSGILRPEIATGKAYGALGMGVGSRTLARLAEQRAPFFGAVSTLAGGQVVPAAGGVLVRDASGAVLGAVGVSGDASDKDEACALAAIAELGLTADPGH